MSHRPVCSVYTLRNIDIDQAACVMAEPSEAVRKALERAAAIRKAALGDSCEGKGPGLGVAGLYVYMCTCTDGCTCSGRCEAWESQSRAALPHAIPFLHQPVLYRAAFK